MEKNIRDFCPDIDGFEFENSWVYDEQEIGVLKNVFLSAVDNMINQNIFAAFGPLGYLFSDVIKDPIDKAINGEFNKSYGRCGGMAYASLDYYYHNLVIPRGVHGGDVRSKEAPQRNPLNPAETHLRDYIWTRLIDSINPLSGGCAIKTVYWMSLLKLIPEFLGGGGPELFKRSYQEEWPSLKNKIDTIGPWPIVLTRDTFNPFDNHQVVVYGYCDDNDAVILYVYDNNYPDIENTIKINKIGETLEESVKPTENLKGFFCSEYTIPDVLTIKQNLPPAICLSESLTSTPAGYVHCDSPLSFGFKVINQGFQPSIDFKLRVLINGWDTYGEDGFGRLDPKVSRPFSGANAGRYKSSHLYGYHNFQAECFVQGSQKDAHGNPINSKSKRLFVPDGLHDQLSLAVIGDPKIKPVHRRKGAYYGEETDQTFEVDPLPLVNLVGLKYSWSVIGATGVGANNLQKFTVRLPGVGTKVIITVTVTNLAGWASTGKIDFTPISAETVAELEKGYALVEKLRHNIIKNFLPHGHGDPGRSFQKLIKGHGVPVHEYVSQIGKRGFLGPD